MNKKPIPNFSNYFATDQGEILNQRGMILAQHQSRIGYRQLKLDDDSGRRRTVGAHRAVASAFLGPIPRNLWVNHKNGIKTDNRLENLEVGTPSYNHLHASQILKRRYARGEETACAALTTEAVEVIKELLTAGKSQYYISRAFQVSQNTISNIALGKTWKS